jgi:hypothetical protein
MPPKEEILDSFETDIISFSMYPRKHPRMGIALIPFSERHEKEVEELGEEDGDDHEELEAGTTTRNASRMNGIRFDEDLILSVEELPPE